MVSNILEMTVTPQGSTKIQFRGKISGREFIDILKSFLQENISYDMNYPTLYLGPNKAASSNKAKSFKAKSKSKKHNSLLAQTKFENSYNTSESSEASVIDSKDVPW